MQSRMMLTGSSTSPFATIESAIYKTLFTGSSPYAALTEEVKKACIDDGTTNKTSSTNTVKESSESRAAGTHAAVSPVTGQNGSLQAKESASAS